MPQAQKSQKTTAFEKRKPSTTKLTEGNSRLQKVQIKLAKQIRTQIVIDYSRNGGLLSSAFFTSELLSD